MAHVRRIAAVIMACGAIGGIAAVGAGCGDSGGGVTANRPGTTTGASVTDTRTYRDASGDVAAGLPDLIAVTIASDATTVSMRFTFRSAPPLRTDLAGKWTDMLLMGLDVPPIGPGPGTGDWMGVDYAFGVHAIEGQARLRAMGASMGGAAPGPPTTIPTRWSGRSISIDLQRSLIGDPPYFEFVAAVGREGSDESGDGDALPAKGTLRYTLAPPPG